MAVRSRCRGIAPVVVRADTIDDFTGAFAAALSGSQLTTIVSKVQPDLPKTFHMDLPLLENRFQFWRQCRKIAATYHS